MNQLTHLLMTLIKAEQNSNNESEIEAMTDAAREEMSIYDAESGADREGGYCPERSFERHYEDAEKALAGETK